MAFLLAGDCILMMVSILLGSRTLRMQYTQMELREEPLWSNEALMYEREASEIFLDLELWYHNIRFYLVRGLCLEHMDAS